MAEYPRLKTLAVPDSIPESDIGDYISAKAADFINSLNLRTLCGRPGLSRWSNRLFAVNYITNDSPSYEEKDRPIMVNAKELALVAKEQFSTESQVAARLFSSKATKKR